MAFRLSWAWLLFSVMMLCLALSGCSPIAESQTDEQKNPHFQAGKERLAALDYKGAIECFERALEDNPRSALAHYELGVLFDEKEMDYPAAIYHYNKALKLCPKGYPAENIRQRIPGCRQELIKADSLQVMNPSALRETERLREQNQALRRQIEALQSQLAGRASPGVGSTPSTRPAAGSQDEGRSVAAPAASAPALVSPELSNGNHANSGSYPDRMPSGTAAGSRIRTHSVKAGDTLASLARLYQIKLTSLQAANPGLEPKRMKIGSVLNIPAS